MRRAIIRLGLGIGMLLGSALTTPVALADPGGAQTLTLVFHDVTPTEPSVNPCSGAPGTASLSYSSVFHITVNKNGTQSTGTMTGDTLFAPDDPAQPTYAGHFTATFGDESNRQNGVAHATFAVHATGSDGSTLTFHENAQATLSANGTITVAFDKMRCG